MVVPTQIRFGQPIDSGLCTGDGFQHFSFEVTRSCLSKPGFSGRSFVTDGTPDRRSRTSIFSVKNSLGPIMWYSFLKLILLPAISGLVCWRLGLQNEATMIVVVFSSLPASASAYVMAHQMGGDAELMASILAIQTLFSVFLLSGILVYFTPL